MSFVPKGLTLSMRFGLRVRARNLAFYLFSPFFRWALRRHNWKIVRALWFNPSSVDVSFLRRLEVEFFKDASPVLELGSGPTSVVLAQLKTEKNREILCLEESEIWSTRTRRRIQFMGLNSHVFHSPLEDKGGFDWYSWIPDEKAFGLVVCDGPASSSSRGGRYGLLPSLGESLNGVTILLDDCDRSSEIEVIKKWETEAIVSVEKIREVGCKTFSVLVVTVTP